MRFTAVLWFFGVLALMLPARAAQAQTPPQTTPPSITAFFKRVALREPKLSPSGRYLAIQAAGKDERMGLAVIDLQTLAPPRFVAGFNDADIWKHDWVNDERLVFQVSNSPDGSTRVMAQGLWAVDREGREFRQLINSDKYFVSSSSGHIVDRRLDINWVLFAVPPGGGDEVIVLRRRWANDPESAGVQISRLNIRTGLTRGLSAGAPDYVTDWALDWRGEVRALATVKQGRLAYYRPKAEGGWAPWFEDDFYVRKHFEPVWIGADDLALATANYHGTTALYRLDMKTGERAAEPLLSLKGYDFSGTVIDDPDTGRLLGIRYETDAPSTAWFDPTMKAHQAAIDAQLRGSVNLIECGRCLSTAHMVVTTLSDQRPPVYYLYTPADKKLRPLAGSRPDLPLAAMGQRDYHRIRARDGLELPVLVTQPAGGVKGKTPTLVLVHGGPYLRGTHWAWQREAQFLASRGYLVREPEFRGSTGFGYAHFRAGWKQWGLAMQDDLADTLAWAVKQGWADPQRACIMGASYGGYAAMMGAVTQGDLFKCAVNWVGVTDIGLLGSIQWSDLSEEWKTYGLTRLVGDPVADAEQIKQTSPLARAKEIRMPLLMAYGTDDVRVPLKHGTDMKAALRPDQPLEWVVYPDEGHGWFNLKTHEDFWGRVERFLAKHLGPPP